MPMVRVSRMGRGWEVLLAVLAATAAGSAGGYLIGARVAAPEAPAAEAVSTRAERVTSLGRLQPTGGIIPVFGPPGDRITEMYSVAPGTAIEAGTRIAALASRKERLQELQIAETQQRETNEAMRLARVAGNQRLAAASAELNQAKANKDADLAAIDARLTFLKLQAETAVAAVARLDKLRTGGVRVPEEDADKARLLAAQGEAELKASEALRKKTETTYIEAEKAAEARIAAAKAELDEAVAKVPTKSAEERLTLARDLAEQTILKAPITGTVLKVTGREGLPTGMEPILQMADLSAMTAIAEVYESDIERLSQWVRAGPVRAEIKNPALPRALRGTVRSEQAISRMIARNQVFAMGPREDVDRRVVEVIVTLDDDAIEPASRFVGLQVTVTLEPQK